MREGYSQGVHHSAVCGVRDSKAIWVSVLGTWLSGTEAHLEYHAAIRSIVTGVDLENLVLSEKKVTNDTTQHN